MVKLHKKIKNDKIICNPKTIDYCELCGRKMKKVERDYRSTNICKSCIKGQLQYMR